MVSMIMNKRFALVREQWKTYLQHGIDAKWITTVPIDKTMETIHIINESNSIVEAFQINKTMAMMLE